jgi:glycosyltransferase involved in cell wall biosynthesis
MNGEQVFSLKILTSMLNIITITKDDFPGLCKTIESTSVLRNKFGVKQLVIDGSVDAIKYKNFDFIKEQNNVIHFWKKPDGISDAFNFGLTKSKSERVWFLNGGDTLYENLDIEMFMSIIKSSSSDILIFEIKENGKEIKHPSLNMLWPPLFNWVSHPSVIIKRDLFKKFGFFDEKMQVAMDGDFWLRTLGQYEVRTDLISIPISVLAPGGLHLNTQIVAQESLASIWKNKNILIKRFANQIFMFFRGIFFYIFKSLQSQQHG